MERGAGNQLLELHLSTLWALLFWLVRDLLLERTIMPASHALVLVDH